MTPTIAPTAARPPSTLTLWLTPAEMRRLGGVASVAVVPGIKDEYVDAAARLAGMTRRALLRRLDRAGAELRIRVLEAGPILCRLTATAEA